MCLVSALSRNICAVEGPRRGNEQTNKAEEERREDIMISELVLRLFLSIFWTQGIRGQKVQRQKRGSVFRNFQPI